MAPRSQLEPQLRCLLTATRGRVWCVLSDWSGDFFDFSLRRWLSAKVEDIIHGGTRDHDETDSAGSQFDDHLGFDRPEYRSTNGFKVVEVDLTVMNLLRGQGSVVSLFRAATPATLVLKLKQDEFHRFLSFDGEGWIAEGRSADGTVSIRDQWVVNFSDGVVQERHIEEPPNVSDPDSAQVQQARQSHNKPAHTPEPQLPAVVDTPAQLPPLAELENLKARELKELLIARGLNTKGKKATLLARLIASHAGTLKPLNQFMSQDL